MRVHFLITPILCGLISLTLLEKSTKEIHRHEGNLLSVLTTHQLTKGGQNQFCTSAEFYFY